MSEDILSLFCSLVKIPSPSGSELRTAKFISAYLKKNGIRSHLDNAGKRIDGNSGNLIAELKGTGPTIMFVAHIDTVELGDRPIKPVIKGNVIKSDGKTILGVDNKASVAALMAAMAEMNKNKDRPNIIAVFSAREEAGAMGVKYLKLQRNPDYAFIIDGGNDLGTFVTSALGQTPFELSLHGKEIHAAHAEKGKNAMKAAGIIIAKQTLGKHNDGSYVNISKVNGGSGLNIVPGNAVLLGEVRAYKNENIQKRFNELERNAKIACKLTGCTYKLTKRKDMGAPPFNINAKNRILWIAKKATKSMGLGFGLVAVKGTIEANILSKGRYPLIGMSRGGKLPHSKSESITVKELGVLKNLIIAISKEANA